MINKTISYEQIGKSGVGFFKDKLRKHRKIASRKTINSLTYKLRYGDNLDLAIEWYADKSFMYIVWGRKAGGKMPPKGIIEQWIKDKRIKPKGISEQSLVFLIRRKIAEKGIKPTNLYAGANQFFQWKVREKLEKTKGEELNELILENMRKQSAVYA